MERNRIEFVGTVERLKSIPTRTGVQMAKWLLKVGDNRFGCVAFGNLAGVVIAAGDGREIGVVGQGAINSWKTDDGTWRNDFQVSAWSVEIDGVATHFERGGSQKVAQKGERNHKNQPHLHPEPPPPDEFDYRGGPF